MKKIKVLSFIIAGLFVITGHAFADNNVYPLTGNVGIGTTTPQSALYISGTQGTSEQLTIDSDFAPTLRLKATDAGGGDWLFQTGGSSLGLNGGLRLYDVAAGTRLQIDNRGYVGIGTTAPQSALDVNGNIQISNADIPMGLMTEVGGTTPILNMSLNFREPDRNINYRGASFRLSAWGSVPLFTWYGRSAGSSSERSLMQLTESGDLGISRHIYTNGLAFTDASGNVYAENWIGMENNLGDGRQWLHIGGIKDLDDPDPVKKRRIAFCADRHYFQGNVGIGTLAPGYPLDVNGTIRAEEIIVSTVSANDLKLKDVQGWADYVFEEDYKLPSLTEVEQHIKQNKHLPGIPSAKDVKENGLAMSDMMAKQMQKIEELTLYMIEMKKENFEIKKDNERLKKTNSDLLARMEKLEKSN